MSSGFGRSLWWPSFHDPSFAPTLRESVSLHWRANLHMLRSPRAIASFCIVSLIPAALLFALLVAVDAATSNAGVFLMSPGGLSVALVVGLAYLVSQHVAFVVAMNVSYGPFVRAAMRDRGIDVCERCGHLLPPALPGSHCAECGAIVEREQ